MPAGKNGSVPLLSQADDALPDQGTQQRQTLTPFTETGREVVPTDSPDDHPHSRRLSILQGNQISTRRMTTGTGKLKGPGLDTFLTGRMAMNSLSCGQ